MNTTPCPRCGKELQIGEWPICWGKGGHGFKLGMQGEFHERDDAYSFPTPVHIDSLAQLRKLERAHGLEPITHREALDIKSVNEQMRDKLRRDQQRPEARRARESAILRAMQEHRR